jgi:hypothetical protein
MGQVRGEAEKVVADEDKEISDLDDALERELVEGGDGWGQSMQGIDGIG